MSATKPSGHGFSRVLDALREPNYRVYFTGSSVSVIGTWLTRTASAWLAFRLTHSEAMLGIVGFAAQIPVLFIAPFAGVWIDRWNRHRVVLLTQILATVHVSLLALLTLTHTITVEYLIALSLFQGVVGAIDYPARKSFLALLVTKRENLPNVIALDSAVFNAARLVGPALAGLLIAWTGEGVCFLLDALSYFGAMGALLMLRVLPAPPKPAAAPVLSELKLGIQYAMGSLPIRNTLVLVAMVGLMGMPYQVLLPAVAAQSFNGGSETFGTMMAASGLGAVSGVLYLASRQSMRGIPATIVIATATFGLALIGVSQLHHFAPVLVLMALCGCGNLVQLTSCNTLSQTMVEEDKRGRVMGLFTLSFFGLAPIGSLIAGGVASRMGAQNTLLLGGIGCLVAAMMFARRSTAIGQAIDLRLEDVSPRA